MRPFGYEADRFTVRDDEAQLIRDAARAVLDGGTIRGVASSWNEAGMPTPGGNQWKAIVVKRVLTSDRIAGKRTLPDGRIADGGWPAIIDARTHKKLVKTLTDESRVTHLKPTTRSYLLTGGIAVCGLCGTALIARPDNKGQRGYVCASGPPSNGCGRIRINGRLVEDEVATRVLARLMRDDFRDRLADMVEKVQTKAGTADDVIAGAKKKQGELGNMYAQGSISAASLHSGNDELATQIDDARTSKKIAAAFGSIAVLDADNLVEWWEGASLEQQRTLLSILVKRVDVFPASVKGSRTFDPNRVKVRWS